MDYIMDLYGIESPPKLPYVGAPPMGNLLQEALMQRAVEEAQESGEAETTTEGE